MPRAETLILTSLGAIALLTAFAGGGPPIGYIVFRSSNSPDPVDSIVVNQLATDLKPRVRPGDIALVSTGVFGDPTAEPEWVEAAGEYLQAQLPGIRLVARTGSIINVDILAGSLSRRFPAVCLVHEPNLPDFPDDFNWEEALLVVQEAEEAARAQNKSFWLKPTGRAILSTDERWAGWDYGILSQHCDMVIPQLQTYCRQEEEGADGLFLEAVETFLQQGIQVPWLPQVTPGLTLFNGASPEAAAGCGLTALDSGARGVVAQWAAEDVAEMDAWLRLMGR